MATIDDNIFHLVQRSNSSAIALSNVFDGPWTEDFEAAASSETAGMLCGKQAHFDWSMYSLSTQRSHAGDAEFMFAPANFPPSENYYLLQDLSTGSNAADGSVWAPSLKKEKLACVIEAQSPQNAVTNACESSSDSEPASPPPRGAKPTTRKNKKPVFWTDEEHERFVVALRRFNGDDISGLGFGVAELISTTLGTRTVPQVRSHAQKYFQELKKQMRHQHIPHTF